MVKTTWICGHLIVVVVEGLIELVHMRMRMVVA
jgi:hypothetical protein